MIALATLLARLVPALAQWFMFSFQAWHIALFVGLVAFGSIFLDKILLVVGYIGALVLEFLVSILVRILIYVVGALPGIPDSVPSLAWQQFLSAVAFANRYMPVDLALTYMGIIFSVYASIWVYKLAKFIRGGG